MLAINSTPLTIMILLTLPTSKVRVTTTWAHKANRLPKSNSKRLSCWMKPNSRLCRKSSVRVVVCKVCNKPSAERSYCTENVAWQILKQWTEPFTNSFKRNIPLRLAALRTKLALTQMVGMILSCTLSWRKLRDCQLKNRWRRFS